LTKFTIITVVKNNVFEIEKTINSLKNQKFKNFEHIIVDANSRDGTSEIIQRKINSKIKHYREKDSGIYDAINKGIKYSKGDYIGLLHAGDFFSSNYVLSLINKVSKNNDILIRLPWKYKYNDCFNDKNCNDEKFPYNLMKRLITSSISAITGEGICLLLLGEGTCDLNGPVTISGDDE